MERENLYPNEDLYFKDLTELIVERLTVLKLKIATVESCTGGALASAITDCPGASEVLTHSLVTYSNNAKILIAGVPEAIIKKHTVYSVQTAEAMALSRITSPILPADIGVGITGSLSRRDPNNLKNSILGRVYIAIMYAYKFQSYEIFETKESDRVLAKKEMVGRALILIARAIGLVV